MADPEVKINVRTVEAGGQSALGKVRSEIGALLTSIPGVGSALGAVASAAGVVGVALATASKALSEFAQGERGIAGLSAALSNVGALTQENVARFQELASELQETTGIADDEWIATLTKLVQFGSKPESVGMDVEAVKNLAGVVGDLGTATALYSKALQGNFEALSRYGIKVKELDELQRVAAERGGGMLEAKARTLGGLFDKLSNNVSDLFESLGQGIARTGYVQAGLGALAEVVGNLAARLGSAYTATESYSRGTAGAAEAMARYREQSEQVLALTTKQVEALAAESKALSEKQRILDSLTDKQAAMQEAQIDLQVATGQMSEKDAIAAKARVRLGASREKIGRERTTAEAQLQLEQEAVAALEARKAAVDADLQKERSRLAPDERLAQIQALVRSASMSRRDYASAAQVAHREFAGDPAGGRAYADEVNADLAGMREWEQRIMARTANQAELRRSRISTLEGMSQTLGEQLQQRRAGLPQMQVATRATVLGAQADLATAQMQALATTAQSGANRTEGAVRTVAATIQESVALTRALSAQMEQYRREIAALRAQVKDHSNR